MKKTILILLGLIVISSIAIMFWPKGQKKQAQEESTNSNVAIITGLKTCEVCGYDAVEKKGTICLNCSITLNSEAFDEEMLDEKSFIVMKQIEFFMPDTLGSEIDFLKPLVSKKGYPKNTNWRPSVYESEIYEFQKMMLEVEATTDSTTTTSFRTTDPYLN